MSLIAHLSITSKTRGQLSACKARYAEGRMLPVSMAEANAERGAGNPGTQILVRLGNLWCESDPILLDRGHVLQQPDAS